MPNRNAQLGRRPARHHANLVSPRPFSPRLLPLAVASGIALGMPCVAYGFTELNSVINEGRVNTDTDGFRLTTSAGINGTTFGLRNEVQTGYLDNRGKISAVSGEEASYGVENSGVVRAFTNTGSIRGSGYGVYQFTGSIDQFQNSGRIEGIDYSGLLNGGMISHVGNSSTGMIRSVDGNAIYNHGTIGQISNRGLIQAAGTNIAIHNNVTGSIYYLYNGGSIEAGNTGTAIVNDNRIDTIENRGLIFGLYAIDNTHAGSQALRIINSGTIAGKIRHNTREPLTIYGGSEKQGVITGMHTMVGDAIGTIVAFSNVNFASDNMLLNSHVSAINHDVRNEGMSIQINERLIFSGNFIQTAGELIFGVQDDTVARGDMTDRGFGNLFITGNTTLASGTGIRLLARKAYVFAPGQRFTVISTVGQADYNEATLKYSASNFGGRIIGVKFSDKDGTKLALVLLPAEDKRTAAQRAAEDGMQSGNTYSDQQFQAMYPHFSPVNRATTGNASAVLSGLFRYQGWHQPLLDIANAATAVASADEANTIGRQLNPSAVTTGAARGSRAASAAVRGIIGNRLGTLRGARRSGVSTGEQDRAPALWGQLFGGRATQGMRDEVSGYHAIYKGMLIGADAVTGPGWRSGALVSYARTTVGNDDANAGSSAAVDNYGITAYTGFSGRPWFMNMTAGVTQQRYNTVRAIDPGGLGQTAHASFNGRMISTSLEGGYPIRLAKRTTLTPSLGLAYSKRSQNAYTEFGSAAALNVAGSGGTSLKSDAGLKLERTIPTPYGRLTPSAQLHWRYEFRNAGLRTTSSFAADTSGVTSFTTVGSGAPRNSGVLGLGVTLVAKPNLTLSANYTLEAASGYKAQTGEVRLRWQY